jgi:hypothetical protein
MTRLRLSAIAAILLAVTACDNTTPTFTVKPDTRVPRYDSVEVDSLEGGGWAGSGHETVSTDTTGRGGGWAGSGH